MIKAEKPFVKEVIVVEGRDDEAAVLRAVEAATIATHGFGIKKQTLDIIKVAYEKQGIIIFTDPDYAGEQIRKRLTALFPEAKQAFLAKDEATKDHDIGVENAEALSIQSALNAAKAQIKAHVSEFSMEDMWTLQLVGCAKAAQNREILGKELKIGSGNAAAFLKKLNRFGITRKELQQAWQRSTALKK
ncbi:MAG: ribonuclease M5 [Clostridia bacterium]|nr:ribonuclease M5 [Clostridia bacterium]